MLAPPGTKERYSRMDQASFEEGLRKQLEGEYISFLVGHNQRYLRINRTDHDSIINQDVLLSVILGALNTSRSIIQQYSEHPVSSKTMGVIARTLESVQDALSNFRFRPEMFGFSEQTLNTIADRIVRPDPHLVRALEILAERIVARRQRGDLTDAELLKQPEVGLMMVVQQRIKYFGDQAPETINQVINWFMEAVRSPKS